MSAQRGFGALVALLVGMSLGCERAPGSAAPTPPPPRVGEASASTLRPVSRGELTVTHGALGAEGDGPLHVREPEVRAVAARTAGGDATLRFSYLGPTERTAPLASGEVRRQVGLKLRAEDGCNLIYVMWRLEPKAELVVSVKENPGQRTHAECGARGYRNVKALSSVVLPPVARGEVHTLAAHIEGETLRVAVDGAAPLTYALGTEAARLRGPVGFRTDNASFDLTLLTQTGVGAATTPEDE